MMNKENLEQFFSHLSQELASAPNEVRRLFHGRGRKWQGLEQLTCDWLQGQLVVSLFKAVDQEFVDALREGLINFSKQTVWNNKHGTVILLQHRYQNGAPAEMILGDLNVHPVVEESGLKFKLDLGRNQNSGLFLDMRYGRNWVQRTAKGKRVLNLFAYTCGFSVAAIEGGAVKVVNVDMAKSSLSKGRENHRINGHDLNKVSFLGHDIFKSWGKIRKSGPYDLIVIDPPSFQKGSFALTKDYKKILRKLPELLADSGQVLACVNSPAVTTEFLIEGMQEEAPQFEYKERLENPPEFADLDEQSSLKALLFS